MTMFVSRDMSDLRLAVTRTLLLIAAVASALALLTVDGAQVEGPIGLHAECRTTCGDVQVPYPFGISPGCYLPGFNLSCDTSRAPPRLFLSNGALQVVDISLDDSTVRVHGPSISLLVNSLGSVDSTWGGRSWGLDDGGPYILQEGRNDFILKGCNCVAVLMLLVNDNYTLIASCISTCYTQGMVNHTIGTGSCSGLGCCQTPVLAAGASYYVGLYAMDKPRHGLNSSVLIAEKGWFRPNMTSELVSTAIPMVLAWVVTSPALSWPNETRDGNETCPTDLGATICHSRYSSCTRSLYNNQIRGYTCECHDGYEGNPYIPDGCRDIDECKISGKCYGSCINVPSSYLCHCPQGTTGDPHTQNGCTKLDVSYTGLIIGLGAGSGAALILIVLATAVVIRQIKAQRKKRLRHRFFKQNRGQLLQQLVCQRADIAERMIITMEEIEKATNNFDKARQLGDGGHGTVYKGILSSLHVVAIKKSKIIIQKEIDEFINEVAILSQINHRNIVKLLGCCLETEVPLLVYEFISNGTLYNQLHVAAPVSLSWKDRLRIAVEVARAIAYLHSFTSMPVIHRDIKSSNILLDDNLTVKLSDFGASRYISVDQIGVDTTVQGTFGYLDPMYCITGHLTGKSDVYSFGVLLIELLTKKKPASYRSSQGYNLVNHFVSLVSGGNVDSILDPQVTREGGGEVVDVALLAAICVKLISVERPTMRQVEMTLESIYAAREDVSSNITNDESEDNCDDDRISG